MKHNREFEIAWQGLKPGPHTYVYDINDRFMQEREVDDSFKDWNAKITLVFDKHENFFMLHFDIDGQVTVPCDRCGDDFQLKLWDEFDLVIKLTGDDSEDIEDEDDVAFIPRSETVINIGDWLYEFLMLSIPLQHIHPENEKGISGCNPKALELLDQLSEHPDKAANPLWKGLEGIKVEDDKKSKSKKQK
ncbi:MAG: hypothetical protein JWQ38_2197 [Flavipsychrobacter sp.]|nr:hypothetical protein [Flavipsychrobacter sp.]